jgi:hypothetical protein
MMCSIDHIDKLQLTYANCIAGTIQANQQCVRGEKPQKRTFVELTKKSFARSPFQDLGTSLRQNPVEHSDDWR